MGFDWRQITKRNPRFPLFLLLGLFILFCFFRGCGQHKNNLADFEILQKGSQKTLTEYTGSDKKVVIPKGVTEIGSGAFTDCTSLKSVVIPKGVKEIGGDAFSGCSSLKSVEIPKGVTEIGKEAFYGCSSLTSVKIPKGVTTIEDGTFEGCESLKSVKIPKGVKVIGSRAFYGCSSLTSVAIPKSVKEIGNKAFFECESLKSLVIPKGVTEEGLIIEHKPKQSNNSGKKDAELWRKADIARKYIRSRVATCNDDFLYECYTTGNYVWYQLTDAERQKYLGAFSNLSPGDARAILGFELIYKYVIGGQERFEGSGERAQKLFMLAKEAGLSETNLSNMFQIAQEECHRSRNVGTAYSLLLGGLNLHIAKTRP